MRSDMVRLFNSEEYCIENQVPSPVPETRWHGFCFETTYVFYTVASYKTNSIMQCNTLLLANHCFI